MAITYGTDDSPLDRAGRNETGAVGSPPLALPRGRVVSRVRCVIAYDQRYLVARHNTRRREAFGKWGLPGGRLKPIEDPKTGLRREIFEELRFRVPYLIELGDWPHRGEIHRVFGCTVGRGVEWFDRSELLAIEWLSYDDVVRLAEAGQLHTGFVLAAISEFRKRASTGPGSIELARRPSKHVRGSRKAPGAAKRLKRARMARP